MSAEKSRTETIASAVEALLGGDPEAQARARAALAADEEERKPPSQKLREALAEVRLVGCHFGSIKWDLVDTDITGERAMIVRLEWRGDMHKRGGGVTEDLFYDWMVSRDLVERAEKDELQERFRSHVERLVRDALKRSWAIVPVEST